MHMATSVKKLTPAGEEAFNGQRAINSKWRWLQLEIQSRN